MYGGLLKSASAVALVAAASLFSVHSAKAADLGGDCCADLEERVAELEATTVRKGNRKVSLTISGFVSSSVLFWNDGTQSDMYIGDSGNAGERFRFTGDAKISPTITAGFTYEFQANPNSSFFFNQLNGGDKLGNTGAPTLTGAALAAGNGYAGCGATAHLAVVGATSTGCPILRDATVWLQSSHLGKVKIGQGSTATDNLVLIDVAGLDVAATPDVALYAGGFLLRDKSGKFGGSTTLGWTSSIRGHESWDTNRREHVLYETPTLWGFSLQTAVAANNYWDVALRYAGEFNGFRVAGGIGYQDDTDFNGTFQQFNQAGLDCSVNCNVKSQEVKGSLSVMHVQTGLFATGAAGDRKISGTNFGSAGSFGVGEYAGPDTTFWWLSAGVSKNFFGMGKTVLFGEYGEHKNGLQEQAFLGSVVNSVAKNGFCYNVVGGPVNNCDSTVRTWGIGVNQYIDAAAMELYATYKNYSLDTIGFQGTSVGLNKNNTGAADMSFVMVGTKINF